MGDDPVRQAIDAVAQFLVSDARLGETLDRIASLAHGAVRPATALSLTLLDDAGRPATRVFAGEIAPAVDQGQYEQGDGPCLTAYREGRAVLVRDTAADADRWPVFGRLALQHGVRSCLALPLVAGGDRMGVMNLYATDEAFTDDDVTDGRAFATQAAVVLFNARAYWQAFDLSTTMQAALGSRATIDQAKGILMAQRGCSEDAAFRMLVAASQRENVRLREVARRLVHAAVREE